MPSYVTDANLNSYQLAFCGGVAGVVSRFVISPLDVVKIRMQLQTHRTHFKFKGETPPHVKYSRVMPALKTILREEGIRGLYKGNLPAEYLYLSYSAVEFWAYKELETLLEKLDSNQILPRTSKTFLAGMMAGTAATSATYPFDLLRTRFAIQGEHKHYTGMAQAIRHIYRQEGLRGLYQGLWPTVVQIMPYMGLLFTGYDAIAGAFKVLRDEQILPASYKPTHDMISGALSGILSKTAIYPFDVVRKRMQVQGPYLSDYIVPAPKIQTSGQMTLWSCFKNIVQQEGARSLYKGLMPSLIKVAPANAVTFLVFEESKKILLWWKEDEG
ncbi:mitochondrial carrier domain-containing protein [Radiomyces spectabilis]|uniref:mitochondrial carrier domain-containing protein n=1 Tax=Radiomyces spectabilis TaxID=64574 RepID=UPI00221F1CB8|nr:mitochondrial carrier domain-containing protein [Radiomyces spectabilis]KAI8364757.1 mitochondrial carrier domain-containing protein [Radiomyces spectabilis]